jgi:hypothetical protein
MKNLFNKLTLVAFLTLIGLMTIMAPATAITYYTLYTDCSLGGSISPLGATIQEAGLMMGVSWQADDGYYVLGEWIDGVFTPDSGTSGGYTFFMYSDHSISVAFAPVYTPPDITTYTITPSHDNHSSITPSTAQTVNKGDSITFFWSEDVNYVPQVTVDSSLINMTAHPNNYTFSSVSTDHSISVTAIQKLYSNYTAFSTTIANSTAAISSFWVSPTYSLSGYVIGTNATGSPVNSTWASFNGSHWGNRTVTLPPSIGTTVGYVVYANDSSGNWATSGMQTLTTTGYYITVISSFGSPTVSGSVCYGGSYPTSITSPVIIDPTHRMVCTGYSIDGAGSTTGTAYTFRNVSASHTITYLWQDQYIGAGGDIALDLQAKDTANNLLPQVQFTLNGTIYSAMSGDFVISGLTSGDVLSCSVSWHGLSVNASFQVSVTGNMTIPVYCRVYPYVLGGVTYHVATDRDVASNVWDGTHFAMGLNNANISRTLLFDAPRIPTYITGLPYDVSDDWNSTTGLFTAIIPAYSVIVTINFDSWGSGFYLQQIDTAASGVSWNSQTLTFILSSSGTGTFIMHCSSRGLPAYTQGLTGNAYDAGTTFLTALYTNQSNIILDWTTQSNNNNPSSNDNTDKTTFSLLVQSGSLGTVTIGGNKTATLTFTFSGTTNFQVLSVLFSGTGSQYVTAVNLPQTFYSGTGTITVDIGLPAGVSEGTYTLSVTVSGFDASGLQRTASGQVSFIAEHQISGTTELPSSLTTLVVALIVIIIVIIVALAVLVKPRH